MSEVMADEITLRLTRTEAIDVGCALRDRLTNTAKRGYDVEKNHHGMLRLCIQLLTVAYGQDWSDEVHGAIENATKQSKEAHDE